MFYQDCDFHNCNILYILWWNNEKWMRWNYDIIKNVEKGIKKHSIINEVKASCLAETLKWSKNLDILDIWYKGMRSWQKILWLNMVNADIRI